MTIPPWSPSALSSFESCPRSYEAVYVSKSVPRLPPGPAQLHGIRVHEAFEKFAAEDADLPPDLIQHASYLDKFRVKAGVHWVELRAAFDKAGRPCSWDWRKDDIWARFVLDYIKVDTSANAPIAWVIDFKTGKQKDDFKQLAVYALWAFAAHPVDLVDVRYYWLQTRTETRKVWKRAEVPDLWAMLRPSLLAYKHAFKEDHWPPKQSGLCRAHCPVLECQFNGRS